MSEHSRTRLFLRSLACLTLAASFGCTEKSAGPTPLTPASSVFLKGGESYTASVSCHPGDNLLARVSQDNIDVTLELLDGLAPDNKKVDFPSGRFGDEFLAFQCGPAAHHRILIANASGSTPGGTVQIRMYSLASAPKSLAEAYRHLANAGARNLLRDDHTWESVLQELRSADEVWKRRGMQREIGLTEFSIAYVDYMNLTDWTTATEHADEAAQAFAILGDETGEAAARQLQGAALEEAAAARTGTTDDPERRRMFAASESLLRQAEAKQRRLGRSFDAAMSHDYLALNFYYQNRQEAAASTLAQAQEQFEALEERSSERMVLQNLATIYYENGNYARAKQTFETLLPLMRMQDDPYLYATVLHNSALVLSVTGDLEMALERDLAALEIQKKRDSKSGQARSLYSIGIAYQRLGQYDRALQFLQNSLVLDKQRLIDTAADQTKAISQRAQLFATLIGVGNTERALGEYAKAVEVHSEARQYASSDKSQARVELAMGLDYAAMGQRQPSLAHLGAALKRGVADSNPYFVETAVARGKVLRESGAAPDALPVLREAARVAAANGNLREQAMVSTELAACEAAGGEHDAALEEIRRAVSMYDRLRLNASSPELRAETTATQRDAERLWVELSLPDDLSADGEAVPERDAMQSLIIADRSHSRGLLELLRRAPPSGSTAEPSADTGKLYDELAGKQATLDALLEKDTVDAQRAGQLRNDIAVLQTRVDLARRSLGSQPLQGDALLTAPQLDELRRRMDGQCEIVEYLLSSRSSWAWVVRHDSVALHRLPSEAAINTLVGRLRRALQAPLASEDGSRAARAVSDAVLGPVLGGSSPACLVVIPDGDLYYVPFAVLTGALGADTAPAPAVAIAPSLKVLSGGFSQGPAREPKSKVVVFAPHTTEENPQAAPLTSLKSEVGAIKIAFGTDRTYVANSSEATRAGFMRFDFRDVGIVHIAAHGRVDVSNGGMSRLMFGDDNQVSGDLRAYDISTMRFNSPLVVLSACESGLGQPVEGEGLLGLAHAFIGAGAQTVLMSLWKVPDEATASLMSAFYRELKGGTVAPERALAAAQRQTRSMPRWRHPYYWSGFELFSTRLQ